MKLLVTGGAGFIGSNFIRYILKKYPNDEILNLDLLTYAGNLENLKDIEGDKNYSFVKGDIADKKLVNDLVKNVDVIVNFAAETHVDRSILDSADFIHTNLAGTHNLLEAAKNNGLKRFHHISTDEVFGSLGMNDKSVNEESRYNPRNPYSASKAGSDHLVFSYYHTFGLPITVSHGSNNYGPYQFPEKFIPLIITNVLEGKKIPVYGDGKNVRGRLHVTDHCEAIDIVLHGGKIGERYCIASDYEVNNLEVVEIILKIMGCGNNLIDFVKDRPGHDLRYSIDGAKLKREFEWVPKIKFEDGIKETIEWYKANKDWWKNIKSGEYLEYYKKQYGE